MYDDIQISVTTGMLQDALRKGDTSAAVESNAKKKIIHHGSAEIITKPLFGVGKAHNDYGKGFYCTEDLELAKEWVCKGNHDGYVNTYHLDITGLRVLYLDKVEYPVLSWIALLMSNRDVDLVFDEDIEDIQWLVDTYAVDLAEFDVVVGYRADDAFFSYARDFAASRITLAQLEATLRLGNLGNQIVLLSKQAFDNITHVNSLQVNCDIYYNKWKERDDLARNAYRTGVRRKAVTGKYLWELRRDAK